MGSDIPPDKRLSLPSPNNGMDNMSGLYWTLHEFDCKQQHVLSFKKNHVVEVTKASSSTNWHRGRIGGKAGFLPANGYLKRINLDKCSKVVVRQDFEGSNPGHLKIYEGQVVSVIVKNDVHWWTVRSDVGKWGLVPAKSLKYMNGSANGEVTVHTPIESPDIVISKPTLTKQRSAPPAADLNSVPRSTPKTPGTETCPPPPPKHRTKQRDIVKISDVPSNHTSEERDIVKISHVPSNHTNKQRDIVKISDVPSNHTNKQRDIVKISGDLVEGVRKKGIKYKTSKEIVKEVLEKLMEDYPEWDTQLSEICTTLYRECDVQSNNLDVLKLEQLFEHLAALTEDEQQRGWICEDDTAEISDMLNDLLTLFQSADPRGVIHVLQTLKYEPLFTLVQYYQLEKRGLLKRLALEVLFESMNIQADPICSILLTSRLPIQLATDIQASKVLNLLEQQCNVFCACLSYPNTMPANHFDQLDVTFITHLLDDIERPDIPYDTDKIIPPQFLKCILALNLHYKDLRNNKICSVLKSMSNATNLTELLLFHFNRGEDPMNYFPESRDSVKKLVSDLFGSADTSELFFTNDVKVLIEVLHRNVIDRGDGDTDRLYYLRTLDLVLTNTDYQDHLHYKDQILELLKKVQEEDSLDIDSQKSACRMIKKHACIST